MIRVYCDKCGKELSPAPYVRHKWRKLHVVSEYEFYPFDLCTKCEGALQEWLKEEVTNEN